MPRTLALFVFLTLGLTAPVTDAMAQSSAGRGAVGGAIIGGAVGGRRGAAVGAATRCRSRSPSRPTLAWPLLFASRSLLGLHRWKVAPRVLSLLQVANAYIGPMP
jgi:hypothetical protein